MSQQETKSKGKYRTIAIPINVYDAMKSLADKYDVPIAKVVTLWPRCPACGGELVNAYGLIVQCSKCGRKWRLGEGHERGGNQTA